MVEVHQMILFFITFPKAGAGLLSRFRVKRIWAASLRSSSHSPQIDTEDVEIIKVSVQSWARERETFWELCQLGLKTVPEKKILDSDMVSSQSRNCCLANVLCLELWMSWISWSAPQRPGTPLNWFVFIETCHAHIWLIVLEALSVFYKDIKSRCFCFNRRIACKVDLTWGQRFKVHKVLAQDTIRVIIWVARNPCRTGILNIWSSMFVVCIVCLVFLKFLHVPLLWLSFSQL